MNTETPTTPPATTAQDAAAPSLVPTVSLGSFLTLHYRLAGPQGVVIDTFGGPPATLTLGSGELSPALEKHLIGLAEGAKEHFDVAPGEAFGDRSAEMVQWVARPLLDKMGDKDERYAVGDVVQFPTPDGLGTYAGAVRQVGNSAPGGAADAVLFDFNHPLAGEPVTLDVHVIGIL